LSKCYNCNAELLLSNSQNVPRSESCHECARDMRVCKMCEFYDTQAYNDCKESAASRMIDKEKANFCDYFTLSTREGGNAKTKDTMLDAASSLFKD
jgi:hypothetical protein